MFNPPPPLHPPPVFCSLPRHLSLLLGFHCFFSGGWAGLLNMLPLSSCHIHTWPLVFFLYSFDRHRCFYLVVLHTPSPPHLSLPPPSPSSLCILDHFLSFQVSGPVEADYPSPGGTGPPHCLRSVSLSLCSRYAHSPHPVCVGGWGRGAGRPQVCSGGHLLQQQTLTLLLVLVSLTHDITHTHTQAAGHTFPYREMKLYD